MKLIYMHKQYSMCDDMLCCVILAKFYNMCISELPSTFAIKHFSDLVFGHLFSLISYLEVVPEHASRLSQSEDFKAESRMKSSTRQGQGENILALETMAVGHVT